MSAPREGSAPDPAPLPEPRGRIAVLDGIRLLAALMVVSYHYLAIGGGWSEPAKALFPHGFQPAAYGWLGVELFFLISGFVICMSCWGKPVGEFFVSRVTRLYPAYWFAIFATTVVVALVPGGLTAKTLPEILTNLTMLQSPLNSPDVDAVYWTLAVELHFYLLMAVVAWRGLTYRKVVVFCCVWAVASVALVKWDDGPLKQMVMPDLSWYFIAGMAFYLVYRYRPNLLLIGIICLCFLVSQRFAVIQLGREERSMGVNVPDWPVTVILAAFFGLMALVATGKLSWIGWRWLPVAGAMTYPLYLLHEYIGWEIFRELEGRFSPAVTVGGTLALMLLCSYLVHLFVERPISAWLKPRMRKSLDQVRTASRPVHHP
ncbi:acyltransferase family protein [Streptomyces fildesensis]|uniref:Acyltransferase family protein n=1 Tax=Streptomyces fildesensis TaxID=375757 RepID=A0ABW8CFS8_9ACTN